MQLIMHYASQLAVIMTCLFFSGAASAVESPNIPTALLLAEIASAPASTEQERLFLVELKTIAIERLQASPDPADAAKVLALGTALVTDIERLHGKQSIELIATLRSLARLHMRRAEPAKALTLLLRAQQISVNVYGEQDPVNRFVLAELAEAQERAGNAGRAMAARLKADNFDKIAVAAVVADGTLGADEKKKQAQYQIVPVHFRTTRAVTGDADPATFFGSARAPKDTFGVSYVSVPKNRPVGTIPHPSLYKLDFSVDPNRHVALKEIVKIDERTAFFASIRSKLATSHKKEVLIYVHGFKQSFVNGVETAAVLAADLELDGTVIAFSWPSKNNLLLYAADVEEAMALRNQEALRDLLTETVTATGATQVYLLAHSLGNRVLLEAMKLMTPAATPHFSSVVFASPDVESTDFSALVERVAPLTRFMTLYTANNDLPLSISATLKNAIFGDSKLIRAGQTSANVPSTKALDVVDASITKADWLGHDAFAYLAKDDLRALFWFGMRAGERCVLAKAAFGSWRYAPAPPCSSEAFQLAALYRRRLGNLPTAINRLGAQQAGGARWATQILNAWSSAPVP